jgi:hypothetical protein
MSRVRFEPVIVVFEVSKNHARVEQLDHCDRQSEYTYIIK